VLSTVNNHSLDYGRVALGDTIDLLKQAGIASVGTGRAKEEANAPYFTEVQGVRLAFLAYTNLYPKSLEATETSAGISSFNLERAVQEITELKKNTDVVMVSFHWGEEYQTESHPRERAIAHALIDAGADLIIGHHPHVVQEVEQYKNGFIAYSLGNFVFDQEFSKATMEGLMIEAVVKDKKIVELNKLPIKISPTFQPYLRE
jgi:gamma-polyglutamate biosynthesis protein CapA